MLSKEHATSSPPIPNPPVYYRLKRAMRLTWPQLAAYLGVSQAAIGHYDVGRRYPTVSIAYRILDACHAAGLDDVRLEDIYQRPEEEGERPKEQEEEPADSAA